MEMPQLEESTERAMRAPRVSQLALPYPALTPLSLRTFLTVPQRTKSMIQIMRVQMKARPEKKAAVPRTTG